MEANDFITKLKADGTEKDVHDLEKVYATYKEIFSKLSTKDKGPFSLNVLCILCRNLDKVPSWRDKIDGKGLLTLSIDCVRGTRSLPRAEQVKTLACVYHIHKYVARLPSQLPPELVLKLSYMCFECDSDNLLTEYCKTYWNLLADRLMYIEKLKNGRRAIIKLLPKLLDDIQKVISMYDTIQFCSTILVFLMKKLHFLYNNDHAKELNDVFGKLFQSLSKKDLNGFKKMNEKEILDVYTKLNDCFYVVAENSVKFGFENSALNLAVRTSVSILGFRPEIFHCLQTFYLNSFCCIFNDFNSSFVETVLNSIIISCESTENLGYKKAMNATYPYINQLLRVFIEFSINNVKKIELTEEIQDSCLKLILLLIDKLKNTEQLLKCDSCRLKSGLHDALRLSFLAKSFISTSLSENIKIDKILNTYNLIVERQHEILTDLCRLGCVNHEKCLRKLQTDIHNTAILLNKSQFYDSAIKLFDVYLVKEFLHFKKEDDFKNISRALYNKSICQLDNKMYESALVNAFLSQIFAQTDGLSSEKYMSLVMDIKAKSVKSKEDENYLQMVTSLDACKMALKDNLYGNLKPFFSNLKFSVLLNHEFKMYAKLWPSIVPIAGVWKTLHDLASGRKETWLAAENVSTIVETLQNVVIQTPMHVRSIHNPTYKEVVGLLTASFDRSVKVDKANVKMWVVRATMLFLKSEFDVAEASTKYDWKMKDASPDQHYAESNRTIQQEHAALLAATEAVDIWTKILPYIQEVPKSSLIAPLQVLRVSLQQLLHARRLQHGLQLAHVATQLAAIMDDGVAYIEAAGELVSVARRCPPARDVLTRGVSIAGNLLNGDHGQADAAAVFLCDAAAYYRRTGHPNVSARLLAVVLSAALQQELPLAAARLLSVRGGLAPALQQQRQCLTLTNDASQWTERRRRSLIINRAIAYSTRSACVSALRLRLWRRGGGALAAARGALPAAAVGLRAPPPHAPDAKVYCNRQVLKKIIGLPTEERTNIQISETKLPAFTPEPKHIETMRDAHILKKAQTSPSIPIEFAPAFKLPEFFNHKNCVCFACENPICYILACEVLGVEASMYFRAKEFDIAEDYFNGVIASFGKVDSILKTALDNFKNKYESYIVDSVEDFYEEELNRVKLQILIEAAYFALAVKNYEKAEEYIYVKIQEIYTDDVYVKNEIANLMIASEKLKVALKNNSGIELEMENLKLSPVRQHIMKTPEAKPSKPPSVASKVIINKEELPDLKCKTELKCKLNFEETTEEVKVVKKKTNFKIPVPIINKAVPETITPRVRSKVKIVLTEPKTDIDVAMTPQAESREFFTPISTPDEFFTPVTSVKTYVKKTLRQNIVKNLEQEFSMPKVEKQNAPNGRVEKENAPKGRVKKVDTGLKRVLKRSTSPGQLTRASSSRLRKPPT